MWQSSGYMDASSESETECFTEEDSDDGFGVNDAYINDVPFGWALINNEILDDFFLQKIVLERISGWKLQILVCSSKLLLYDMC